MHTVERIHCVPMTPASNLEQLVELPACLQQLADAVLANSTQVHQFSLHPRPGKLYKA